MSIAPGPQLYADQVRLGFGAIQVTSDPIDKVPPPRTVPQLEQLAARLEVVEKVLAKSEGEQPTKLEKARSTLRERRRRDRVFRDHQLFGEPAWDLLIDLYVAMGDRRKVSVSSACIAAAAPATTALRYIAVMEERGLLEREPDQEDRRRAFLRLTAVAISLVEEAL